MSAKCVTFFFLDKGSSDRGEEVPAAHPGPAKEGADESPGLPETTVSTAQGTAERSISMRETELSVVFSFLFFSKITTLCSKFRN